MTSKSKTPATPATIKLSNLVHKDIILGENIKKEMKYADRNIMQNYQLNPNNVFLMPDKPTAVNPQKQKAELLKAKLQGGFTSDPVEEAFSNEKLEKALKSRQLGPRQKFQTPMTANQEIGWFANQAVRSKSVGRDHRLKSNEITKFANDYYELKKVNPFLVR